MVEKERNRPELEEHLRSRALSVTLPLAFKEGESLRTLTSSGETVKGTG